MEHLIVEVEENKTYWQRMKYASYWRIISLSFILLIYFLVKHFDNETVSGTYVFIGWCCLLLLLFFTCDQQCACKISVLEITKDRVHIVYEKRNKNFDFNDSLDKIVFKERFTKNGVYFEIVHAGNTSIKQYKNWSWDKLGAFDQTIAYLEKRNLLAKKTYGWWV